jgi:hypothetical protein
MFVQIFDAVAPQFASTTMQSGKAVRGVIRGSDLESVE